MATPWKHSKFAGLYPNFYGLDFLRLRASPAWKLECCRWPIRCIGLLYFLAKLRPRPSAGHRDLPVIFYLLVELIEWQAPRRLGFVEESLLVLTLAIVTVTLSYNASYDPYFSDIASPMAIDLLEIIAIMAAIYFLWRQNWFFLTMWSLLAFLGRPTGILVMGLLTVGVLVLFPEKRKVWGSVLIGLIVSLLFLGVLYDKVYYLRSAGQPILGSSLIASSNGSGISAFLNSFAWISASSRLAYCLSWLFSFSIGRITIRS